jgi:hypothetical protein
MFRVIVNRKISQLKINSVLWNRMRGIRSYFRRINRRLICCTNKHWTVARLSASLWSSTWKTPDSKRSWENLRTILILKLVRGANSEGYCFLRRIAWCQIKARLIRLSWRGIENNIIFKYRWRTNWIAPTIRKNWITSARLARNWYAMIAWCMDLIRPRYLFQYLSKNHNIIEL